MKKRTALVAGVLVVAATAATAALANTITGPSSSQSPYVVPSQEPGVVTKSILTVGDSVNDKLDGTPYRHGRASPTAWAPTTTATARSRC